MNEPVAELMQRDLLPGLLILERTDGVISSGVTLLFCYQEHPHPHQSKTKLNQAVRS